MTTEAEIMQRLAKRRRDLEQVLASAERRSENENLPDELSSEDQHPGDLATDLFERTRNYSVAEMAEGALEEIDLALRHLDEGSYGICELCRKPIDPERLEARPEARYCVEHAPRVERAAS